MSAFGHRNVLYNSLPTLRRSAMGSNFDSALFTVTRETKAEIFRALSLLLGETAPAAGNNTEFTAR